MGGDLGFAVVDVETTGFSPRLRDRIIEIAIIRMSSRGETEDEYVTLVNPQRDVGPTYIHGIAAGDVVDAPVFDEIVGDVVNRLGDSVFVAHNVRFDRGFMSAELSMAGVMLPEVPALCTLELAYKLHPGLLNHKLATCCDAIGIEQGRTHSALEDARAVAALVVAYLEAGRSRGWETLEAIGCAPLPFPSAFWPTYPRGGPVRLRGAGSDAQSAVPFLARVVASLGATSTGPRLGPYMDLLDRVLEDRLVTEEEATALSETAAEWGVTREEALRAHHAYLEALIGAALADGIVTDGERRDLDRVAGLLAVDPSLLGAMLHKAHRSPLAPPRPDQLVGKTVCFTGTLSGTLGNRLITREVAIELATNAGLRVMERVTKDLDLLVVADPHSQSGKAKLARKYGTRIMAEDAFWPAIGVSLEY